MCHQHRNSGPVEVPWHTARGYSPHRPFGSKPGKKFKSPGPKSHLRTERSQARRSSMLPRTLPATGLTAEITTLGLLTCPPLLHLGTLFNAQNLVGPGWGSEKINQEELHSGDNNRCRLLNIVPNTVSVTLHIRSNSVPPNPCDIELLTPMS